MITVTEANSPMVENMVVHIERTGLKKKVIAKRAGLTQNELTDILGGRRIIKICQVLPIASALNVEPAELFKQTK